MRDVSGVIVVRAVLGGILALGVGGAAWRARALSRGGMIAACLCGTLASVGGWSWATLLIGYFIAATVVSRVIGADSTSTVARVVEKGSRRDATQVLANGGLFSVAAALTVVVPVPVLAAGALGALAASSADTWATEFGLRFGGRPRRITSGARVVPGQSGGVTAAGFGGSMLGALFIAIAAIALGFPRGLGLATVAAGLAGSLVDSILGATVQERRYCDNCDEPTERLIHACGSPTRITGGIQKVDNDVVNILSTVAGFLSAMIVHGLIPGSWSMVD